MTDPDLIGLFVEPLDRLAIPYMIRGGVASVIRHLRDVAMMLRISGDLISRPELARWIERLDLGEAFARARVHGSREL